MKSVKFFELIILALIGSLLVALAGANADPLDDFMIKPLQVNYADVPPTVDRPASASVSMTVLFANSCYQIFQPRVQKGPSNVIEIFPYATVKKGMCAQYTRTLNEAVDLGMLQQGDYLVRIHSADGSSIDNKMTIR